MIIRHPNLSIDYLQNMSREDAFRLFKRGKGINLNELFCTIILAASKLHWENTRGVREFWYNPIKPILYNVIGEEADVGRKYDQFDGALSSMVKEGIVTYRQLGIVDYRTMRELYETIDRAECWNNVILFVEKDSAYVHLRPLKDLLNITILSGGGVSKTACAEDMKSKLDLTEYTIFTVTDYDPWGFFIGEEVAEKFKILGLPINTQRIGINPDQVAGEILESQKYPIKLDIKAEEWCPNYGLPGALGEERYGIEIEAISGQMGGAQKLREIVLAGLFEYLDEEDRLNEIKTPLWDNITKKKSIYGVDNYDFMMYKRGPYTQQLKEYLTPEEYQSRYNKKKMERNRVTKEVDELRDEILEKIDDIHQSYQQQLTELEREYTNAYGDLEVERNEVLEPLREEERELDRQWDEIAEPFNDDLHYLDVQSAISRYLFVKSRVDWLENNIDDRYIRKSNEVDDLSWGLMKGIHLEASKKNENFEYLLGLVHEFDSDRIVEHIQNEILYDDEVKEELGKILNKLINENLKE